VERLAGSVGVAAKGSGGDLNHKGHEGTQRELGFVARLKQFGVTTKLDRNP
jgi:hypothetical protein